MKIAMTLHDTERILDLDTMLVTEAEELEAVTGWTAPEWQESLFATRALAVAFGWYLACKRAGDDVDYETIRLTLDLGALNSSLVEEPDPVEPPAALGVTDESGPTSSGPEPTPPEPDSSTTSTPGDQPSDIFSE